VRRMGIVLVLRVIEDGFIKERDDGIRD